MKPVDSRPADPTRPAREGDPAAERRWRALTEALGAVIWISDAQGGFSAPQPAFEAYTGIEWPAVSGFGWLEAIHPDNRRRFETAWKRALREKTPFEAESRIRHAPSGRWRWFEARAVPVTDEAGVVREWVGTITDVDERRRAVDATRRSQAELAEAHRRKDEFLATLAHELRNPLAPIRNAVEVMRLRGTDDPTLRWARGVMERQVAQMARLVDDLLDVSRMTRGDMELRREVVELKTIIARAAETASPVVDARHHSLIISLPPEPLRLEADALRLEQVLINLLDNAAKYTEPGGRIWVTGRRAPGADDEVEIHVRDTGIGIDAASLPHIFDVFSQADRSLKRGTGGLGIGLTLARRIVEMHGGTLTAESDGAGCGAEFVLRLPALKTSRALAELPAAPPERVDSDASPARILVVDDNVDSAESIALLLRMLGHDVRVAHDGPAAITRALSDPPDVVLLDIAMPGMDGYEVATVLRAEPALASTRLVALTGYGQPEDRARSAETGFDDHLVKPVELDALRDVLSRPGRREPS